MTNSVSSRSETDESVFPSIRSVSAATLATSSVPDSVGAMYFSFLFPPSVSVRYLRRMVLQKNELFSGTIAENLRWGNENATDEQLKEACRLACAEEFINAMPEGYNTHIEQGGTNVSGGQKQRLCIARALLKSPKVLILDDSTSAVDTRTDAEIRKAFAEKIPNTTKIIIAQRVASVQEADRIIVMKTTRRVSLRNGILKYAEQKYHVHPEYPWQRLPDYCVLRHAENRKWFAIVMNVCYEKFGIAKEGYTDILDIKVYPALSGSICRSKGFYSGYHMTALRFR